MEPSPARYVNHSLFHQLTVSQTQRNADDNGRRA